MGKSTQKLVDWKQVLWTDESKFELFGSNHRVYVRRQTGDRLKAPCVTPTIKHGGGSAMVWGCFTGDRVGDLFEVKGIMTKKR